MKGTKIVYHVVCAIASLCGATNGFSTATPAAAPTPGKSDAANGVIPITVLSGFLGSGKTTLLQHMLTNNEGLRIAVIVNDVAEVNIDNKLIAGRTAATGSDGTDSEIDNENAPAGIVQLSNGCACCSLSEELLVSVSELVTVSDMRSMSSSNSAENKPFDHIVIELSGISSPRAIRANFQDATFYGMPLMERVRLDTMVTVVDCSTFMDYLEDDAGRLVNMDDAPALFFPGTALDADTDDSILSYDEIDPDGDIPPDVLKYIMQEAEGGGGNKMGEPTDDDPSISQLLVEQTEIADVVLLNKIDILEEDAQTADRAGTIEAIVARLNTRAVRFRTKFGVVERLGDVLAMAKGKGVVDAGVVDDHRDSVIAAESAAVDGSVGSASGSDVVGAEDGATDLSNGHSHEHKHEHEHEPKHEHGHGHEHSHDPEQKHELSHSHDSHEHEQKHESSHSHDSHSHEHSDHKQSPPSPECTDTSHSHTHSHSHSHSDDEACTDPTCTDPTHSHSHNKHAHGGIGTYVYRARRPFHPTRLTALLRTLPVVRGLPKEEEEEGARGTIDPDRHGGGGGEEEGNRRKEAFGKIIRSKGFVWLADSHEAAMYWSHAGSSFEMQCLGRWWASLPQRHWPEESVDTILSDFDSPTHSEEATPTDEKDILATVGDRRQELVLIGPGMFDAVRQDTVRKALDECLLNDKEFHSYKSCFRESGVLKDAFVNPLDARMVTY